MNVHAALAQNLLPNPADEGRVRQHAVDMGLSVYRPISTPQLLEDLLDVVIAKANMITDPFEQSFFMITGVLIPWARTWPQEVRNGDNVSYIAPEPNEIAGYAAVVYRKQCPDQAAQAILHVGQQEDVLMVKREAKAGVLNNRPARAMDVLSGNQDFRPQWLPQVVERAVQLAPSNAAAKQFVLAAQPQLLQAVPELKAQIESVK